MQQSTERGPNMGRMNEALTRARHRLNAVDYHRMAEASILRATDRVELIEGDIVDMAPIGSRHASRCM